MNRFTEFHRGKSPFPTSILGKANQNIAAEVALGHLSNIIKQLKRSIHSIKQNLKNVSDHGLSSDELVAIYLCRESLDHENIDRMLNDVLQTEDIDAIKPWFRYLALLNGAWKKLLSKKGEVWRGIDIELAKTLKEGDEFYWWTISSCCSSKKLIRRHLVDGIIPYSIEIINGKNIPSFSNENKEIDEIILFPGTHVRVQRCSYDSSTGNYDIHLIQLVDSDPELIEESISNTGAKKQVASPARSLTDSSGTEREKEILLEIKFNNGNFYQINRPWGKQRKNTVFVTRDGTKYENEEADRRAKGEGKRKWTNGDQYSGFFTEGKRNGHGTLRCSDEYSYVGHWSTDEIHGEGTSTWRNHFQYAGNHTHGRITGEGRVDAPNGDIYIGQLFDGKAHGKRKRIWSNGDKYNGDFENDIKHGHGIYSYVDGSRYSGSWLNDQMNGKGTLIWSSGSQYEGEFKKGQRHGQGKFTYTDGRILKGEWKKDQFIAS